MIYRFRPSHLIVQSRRFLKSLFVFEIQQLRCFSLKKVVSIPLNRTIHLGILRHTDYVPEEITMHKARLTEHLIITVLKSVEAGRAAKDICREAGICEA